MLVSFHQSKELYPLSLARHLPLLTRCLLFGGGGPLVELYVELVGGFNPSEKYARQIGLFPQIGMKIPKIFELPPPSTDPLIDLGTREFLFQPLPTWLAECHKPLRRAVQVANG